MRPFVLLLSLQGVVKNLPSPHDRRSKRRSFAVRMHSDPLDWMLPLGMDCVKVQTLEIWAVPWHTSRLFCGSNIASIRISELHYKLFHL